MTTMHEILKTVAEEFRVSAGDLAGQCRARKFSDPRHIYCILARRLTTASLTQIGAVIGRHHTTVLYSIRSEPAMRKRFGEEMKRLEVTLKPVFIRRHTTDPEFRSVRGGAR